MLNRAALILNLKKPFIEWINDADPCVDDPGITLADANRENTVYLLDNHDAEDFEAWVKLNYDILFEAELLNWYTDEKLWPQKRTYSCFKQWVGLKCHSMIFDAGRTPIVDDGD